MHRPGVTPNARLEPVEAKSPQSKGLPALGGVSIGQCRKLMRVLTSTAVLRRLGLSLGVVLAVLANGPAAARSGAEAGIIGSRLLHYTVRCAPGERCKMECFQGGRIVVSRARIEENDRVTLVMTDGFSDRLQPLWIEIIPADSRDKRTILLPRDVLCDFQGLTIQPIGG